MEAKSKTCAKEIFKNASVSANTNLAASDVASEDALEAGADKSTSRSPFFEKPCWRCHTGRKTGRCCAGELEDTLVTGGESRDGGSDFASKAGSRIGTFPESGFAR